MHNPYQTPSSDLSTQGNQSNRLDIFNRFSTWYVFILTLVTLNLYLLYWFYNRTRTLNQLKDISPIGDAFIFSALAINIITYPFWVGELFFEHIQEIVLASQVVSLLGNILLLVWSFKLRNRLNTFLEKNQAPHSRLGPVFTFLFQALYLNFKINENLELLESASAFDDKQDHAETEAPVTNSAEAS
jgi:hypothetical protein